jgi:very-short-patch-repair endonuclease
MVSEPHAFARTLRQSATTFEDMLWQRLRGSRLEGAKFKRQVPFGPYVADFYCHSARLIVEIDGAQHDWQGAYDAERTKVLEAFGVRVIRFANGEIRDDIDAVLRQIREELRLPFR